MTAPPNHTHTIITTPSIKEQIISTILGRSCVLTLLLLFELRHLRHELTHLCLEFVLARV